MSEFLFKPFEEMTEKDYAEVGFMSGLEIHQQLFTDRKLFCRCPAGHYSDEYHAEILRHMRPTLSELGEYDGTALMEFKTKKDIIYRINRNTVCTYEMDDTPPFEMNEDALDIGIEVGMLLNAKIVDEIHIARKQYLDGSIPTGFQRTAIISVGGWIPFKDRKINIIQMSIEEDSCREYSDKGHTRIYLTDRLGMPLIETVTHPDMKTPQEVAEVNDILRRLSRSTGKVRTGVGATRQDVNVSVRGGTRIEIKGVPSIKRIPLLTYNEAMRQWNLLRLRTEMHNRGITETTFEHKVDEVTNLLKKTHYQPIADAIGQGKRVLAVTLRKCKGLLRWQTQTDTTFAKEISDRVRVIACLTDLPNITHSDYPGETISSADGSRIRQKVGAGKDDALVLVWGSEQDTECAAREIAIRVKEATIGVPSETRQALSDGTNGFERILPGPERMYPDTDLPPKKLSDERKEAIRKGLPEQIWRREGWYREIGVHEDFIKELAKSKFAPTFEKLVKDWDIDPKLLSFVLIPYMKRLKKKKIDINLLSDEIILKIFDAYRTKKIIREGIFVAVEKSLNQGKFTKEVLPKPVNLDDIKDFAKKSLTEVKKMTLYYPDNLQKILMGVVMNKYRGKISGAETIKYVEELAQQEG